jgi:hypothetical protein
MTSIIATKKLINLPKGTLVYKNTITAIKEACSNINLTYSNDSDGRIVSAIKEKEYLTTLQKSLNITHPTFNIEIPKDRFWYDIRINEIPLNLKLTTGGTDNAFNKEAIIYTLSGVGVDKKNMNFCIFWDKCMNCQKKDVRDKSTEYHYLVVNKITGKILIKSILDIHTFKTNPCNIMQINWKNEFNHIDYEISDDDFKEKIKQILKTIQTSVKQYISSTQKFADANVDDLYSG